MTPRPDEIYEVPAEIAVALGSARPELLGPLIHRLERGETRLNKKSQLELVKLLQGLLKDKVELQSDLAEALARLDIVADQNNQVLAAARRLGSALVVDDLSVFEGDDT